MKKLLFVGMLLFSVCNVGDAQTQVIAHRGFWKVDGSSQNSKAALLKADSIGCYGSEFDVRLSGDNELVINHDRAYGGRAIGKTSSAVLTTLKLPNGENLPTLNQYLIKARKINIRLILELKPHTTPERETLAVEKVVALVKEMNLEERTEYISFSLHIVKEFIRLAPAGTPVFFLGGTLSPKELKQIGCAGPDYHLKIYRKHPEWIAESHALGLKVNAWTVNDPKDMQWLIDRKADYITTDRPLVLQHLLFSKTNSPK